VRATDKLFWLCITSRICRPKLSAGDFVSHLRSDDEAEAIALLKFLADVATEEDHSSGCVIHFPYIQTYLEPLSSHAILFVY
jgi:hypothetical protein